jgi:hypothetical protein
MPRNPTKALACALALCGPLDAALTSGDQPPAQPPRSADSKCEVAVVNPVTGYAECVKPRGVPVDQPPARPAPSRQECLEHRDLDIEACRQYATPPGENPR